jgi:hypothetical protein
MRIVEELSSFYRHIYLNLPGFTRLVGATGAGAPLRFGVFPANLYKLGEPTSGLEPMTSSLTSALLAIWVPPEGLLAERRTYPPNASTEASLNGLLVVAPAHRCWKRRIATPLIFRHAPLPDAKSDPGSIRRET